MIYFVQLDSGAIKIGFTKKLESRLKDLKNIYASKIRVLATMEGDKLSEHALHRRFAHLRFVTSEQFRPSQELFDFIGKPLPDSFDFESVKIQPRSSTLIQQAQFRLTEAELVMLDELGQKYGQPELPLDRTAVLRVLIRRAHKAESRKQTKSRTK